MALDLGIGRKKSKAKAPDTLSEDAGDTFRFTEFAPPDAPVAADWSIRRLVICLSVDMAYLRWWAISTVMFANGTEFSRVTAGFKECR